MEIMLDILLLALSFILGFVMRSYGSRKSNPSPHRLADSWYYVFYPDGEACALTTEVVEEGKIRAQRLKIK